MLFGFVDSLVFVLFVINVVLLFVGIFLDMMLVVFIFVLIFLLVVIEFGIDLVYFGMIMVFNFCVGLCMLFVGMVFFVGLGVV